MATPRAVQAANIRELELARQRVSRVIAAGTQGASRDGLAGIGTTYVARMKRKLSQPGTGRVYRLTNPRRVHRASAPGQPPAVDTGRYRGSWTWQLGPGYVEAGTNVKYGPDLEFGTRRMDARPHARPVTNSMIADIPGIIAKAIVAGELRAVRP